MSALPVNTGTAQESDKRETMHFSFRFAPYENPEIAVTVNIRTVIPHPMPQWWQNTYTVTTTIPH